MNLCHPSSIKYTMAVGTITEQAPTKTHGRTAPTKSSRMLKSDNKEDKIKYFNLASIHNLRFIVRLTEEAREAILNDNFDNYKETFLKNYYQQNKKENS